MSSRSSALAASLFFVLISFQAKALTEVTANFGYKKQVYGASKQNKLVSRDYSGVLAFYFLSLTGIEFNYNQNDSITTEKSAIAISGTNLEVSATQNRVKTYSYGLGLRQALAGPKAFIRPILSVGYARQFVKDTTDITFKDTTTGTETTITDTPTTLREDSVFGTFSLQVKLTKSLSLNGSVHTLFPAFEFDRASDYLKYMLGLSWRI